MLDFLRRSFILKFGIGRDRNRGGGVRNRTEILWIRLSDGDGVGYRHIFFGNGTGGSGRDRDRNGHVRFRTKTRGAGRYVHVALFTAEVFRKRLLPSHLLRVPADGLGESHLRIVPHDVLGQGNRFFALRVNPEIVILALFLGRVRIFPIAGAHVGGVAVGDVKARYAPRGGGGCSRCTLWRQGRKQAVRTNWPDWNSVAVLVQNRLMGIGVSLNTEFIEFGSVGGDVDRTEFYIPRHRGGIRLRNLRGTGRVAHIAAVVVHRHGRVLFQGVIGRIVTVIGKFHPHFHGGFLRSESGQRFQDGFFRRVS